MAFDPYYHWLGIPPREQPPNHYRLLGIELFEPNEDVISFAADRQMAHLRGFQNSRQSADSQKLLNEVSAARVCLLSPERRAAYDAELRSRLAERAAAAQSHPSQLTPPDHTPPHSYGPSPGAPGATYPGRGHAESAYQGSTQSGTAYPNAAYPNPAHPNPAHPNPAHPNPAYLNSAYSNPAYPNPAYPNPAYPNPAYPNPGYPNTAFADPPHSNPAYPDPAYPGPAYPAAGYSNPAYANPANPGPAYAPPAYWGSELAGAAIAAEGRPSSDQFSALPLASDAPSMPPPGAMAYASRTDLTTPNAEPAKTAATGPLPEPTGPAEVIPADVLPANTTTQYATSTHTSAAHTSATDTVPADTVPADTVPQDEASANSPPADADSGDTVSAPSSTAPRSATPNTSATAKGSSSPTAGPASNRPIPRPVPKASGPVTAGQPLVVNTSNRASRHRPRNAGVELFKIVAGGLFGCVCALAFLWFGFDVDPVGWHDHVDPKVLEDVSRRLGRQQVATNRGGQSGDRGSRGRSGSGDPSASGGSDNVDRGDNAGGASSGADRGSGMSDGDSQQGGSSNAGANPAVGQDGRSSGGSGGNSSLPTAKGRNGSASGDGNSAGGAPHAPPGDSTQLPRRPGATGPGHGAGPGILARGTLAVPALEARSATLKLLDESYKVAAAKTPSEKKACAEKLLAAAKEGSISDAERFALWQRAASLAAESGDAKMVQTAIEEIARTFDFDAGKAMETLLVLAMDHVKDEAALDACIPVTQKTIFEFIVRDEVDAAVRLTDATYTLCLKAIGKKHRKFVFDGQALVRRLEQHWLRARDAREAIASGAGTPAHQRELGRFLCVYNGQWDQGLPHLVQSDNEAYAAAARLDLENPADHLARIAIADRWYEIATANPSDEGFAARAIHWYSQSLGGATGIAKTKAMTRLDELRQILDELDKRELSAARIVRGQFR